LNFADLGLSIPANRYFQYKLELGSENSNYIPQLKNVTLLGPVAGYPSGEGTIVLDDFVNFNELGSFTQILGPNGCSGTPKYLLSPNSTDWYHYIGGAWGIANNPSTYADGNT